MFIIAEGGVGHLGPTLSPRRDGASCFSALFVEEIIHVHAPYPTTDSEREAMGRFVYEWIEAMSTFSRIMKDQCFVVENVFVISTQCLQCFCRVLVSLFHT